MDLFDLKFNEEVELTCLEEHQMLTSSSHCFLSCYDKNYAVFNEIDKGYWVYCKGELEIELGVETEIFTAEKEKMYYAEDGSFFMLLNSFEEVLEKAEEHFLPLAIEGEYEKPEVALREDDFLYMN